MTQKPDPMAEIRASFFVECEELLESLQDALSTMDDGADDAETINVAFRAVHSIKGGAGAFGLNALVAYAHRFETVMDEVRAGRLHLSAPSIRLFFQAADTLADHVRSARDGALPPANAEDTLVALEALMGGPKPDDQDEVHDFEPLGLSISLDLAPPDPLKHWHVSFRPHDALYASGNEPLLILRALADQGHVQVDCDQSALPPLSTLNPEQAHLHWTVSVSGDADEGKLREVFDFVDDVADISILPAEPQSEDGTQTGECVQDPAVQETTLAATAPSLAPPETWNTEDPRIPPAEPPGDAPSVQSAAPTGAAVSPPTITSGSPAPDKGAGTPEPPGATVRVDIDRIDRLVNLVGELVINQAMLQQSIVAAGLAGDSGVMTGLEGFMTLTRDIQESVMMIRAQPVKPLFQRMGRIVREASAAVGKSVRLRTEGEGTEVDKTVIERLADPLTHMIRNAVDHGLEAPDRRIAAGKPAEGVITLRAQHRSGRVVIEVADDGGGIDRARVLSLARSRNLVAHDAQLSESEIDNLLFLPGFSTATSVSNLSGRGVGMDVVKKAIQGLGGRIAIESRKGLGTCFSISLPLTLAVLDGMVVRVAGETLVVPLSAVLETATLAGSDLRELGPSTHVIHVRGGFVPLYDLGVELGYRAPRASYADGIVLLAATEEGSRAALVVDEIVEQRQVVIKGLHHTYGRVPGIAAATILGDGQIALILDPADLVQMASGLTRPADFALAG